MSEINKWFYPKTGIHGKVVHEIGMEIVTGILKPGDLIPHESDIIKRFKGSRTAIREAFRVLTAKGLIEARQRAGTCVREQEYWNLLDPDVLAWQSQKAYDRNDFRNMVETRKVVEPVVAGLAALRATDEEIDHLEDTYISMQEAVSVNSLDNLHSHCVDFHMVLFEICHNDVILRLSGVVRALCDYQFELHKSSNSMPDGIIDAYGAILTEIRNRDVEGSERTMRALIEAKIADMKRFRAED
ncbi:MAG: hypothetical protein COB93_01075 [Sneathiella sp.]|nr:MAG: hypothetical protein COB93_01075 [Sneathiella sp.]